MWTSPTFLTHFCNGGSVAELFYNPLRIGRIQYQMHDGEWKQPDERIADYYVRCAQELLMPWDGILHKGRTAFVYVGLGVSGRHAGLYKIGYTTREDISIRLRHVSKEYETETVGLWAIESANPFAGRYCEKTLHYHFRDKLAFPREWFALDDTDIDQIRTLPRGINIEEHLYRSA